MSFKLSQYLVLSGLALSIFASSVQAEPISRPESSTAHPWSAKPQPRYRTFNNSTGGMEQVTSVSELRDVEPTEWAYEALRSLVERYGCIVGYPDRTFRGNRALTRWEFAAGLNACMNVMERLIQENVAVLQEDIDKLKRLAEEFQSELTALGTRLDNLESRVSFLEDNQFSTTTKLVGETAFNISQAFGGDIDNGSGPRKINSQTVFTDKVRLQLVTSFTGKDQLFTRLTAASIGNSFQNEIGDFQGRFAFDGPNSNNDVIIDRLHYYFPVGDKLKVFTMASLGGHHFYADTFNAGLEAGGGASGALTRFGERNPIYRLGLGGQGLGLKYNATDWLEFSAGYLARQGFNPAEGKGLFNGNYSAMGQLVVKPTDNLKFGLNYLNGYDPNTNATGQGFRFGGTGTLPGNLQLSTLGVANRPVSSNSYGVQGQFDVADNFSIRAWGGYTDAKLIEFGDGEIWNYALVLAFPDLGKEGSMGAIIVGAEPYLGGIEIPNRPEGFNNDTPFHVEVSYKYPINNNISLTPGLIILTSPNQDSRANDTVYIGTLRTTFKF
ncbi:MAG: iron uptake porin [Microcystaceae cyanobacterium]